MANSKVQKCPHCNKVFYGDKAKKQLAGHIGGAHRRGEEGPPTCSDCGQELIPGKNWPAWAVNSNTKLCRLCKNARLRKGQRKSRVAKRRGNPTRLKNVNIK